MSRDPRGAREHAKSDVADRRTVTITPPRSLIVCDICNASWQGTEGDGCYWCDKRYEQKRDSERRRLIWPEWLGWSERFLACSEIDQAVWAETRGLTGDYLGKWQRDLTKAVSEGLITDAERANALARNAKWMTTHLKRPDD